MRKSRALLLSGPEGEEVHLHPHWVESAFTFFSPSASRFLHTYTAQNLDVFLPPFSTI